MSGEYAGESGVRSSGRFKSEITTAAQYPPLRVRSLESSIKATSGRTKGDRNHRSQCSPYVHLSPNSHLEPPRGHLQQTQPPPQGPPINNLIHILTTDERQSHDDGISGSQVRQLAAAAAEPARGVLHGAGRLDEPVPVGRDVPVQQTEGVEAPVEEPGPPRVGGDEGRRELAQLAVEEARVPVAVEVGDAVGVGAGHAEGVGGRRVVLVACQVGEAGLDRVVLGLGGCGLEGVPDGGWRGEDVGDHGGG